MLTITCTWSPSQLVTSRKRAFWGVVFALPIGYSGPPSAVNDQSAITWNKFVKAFRLRVYAKICRQQVAPFCYELLHASSFLEFLRILGRPPGLTPLPPRGGRTRCRLHLLCSVAWASIVVFLLVWSWNVFLMVRHCFQTYWERSCSSWIRRRSSSALEDMLHQVHRAQAYHSQREDLSVSLSSSSMSDRTGRPVGDIPGRHGEHKSSKAQIRTLLDNQKEQILAEFPARIHHHEFQAVGAEEEQRLFQGQFLQQNLEFREAHQQSLTQMEELRKFQSSTFDTIARRKLIEDLNTVVELSGRVQELQNEVYCMNDSKDFQDAESVRSGNSHVTSRPVPFTLHPMPEGILRHSFVSPRRKEGPPSIWDTHGTSGKRFCKSRCVIISTLSSRIASSLNKIIDNSHFSKGKSIWRNRRPRKRTVSFEVDRLPIWSTITSGSLGPMILSRTLPTCSPLFFEMTIFRNSILSGTENIIVYDENPAWWHFGRIVQIQNKRVWKTQDRIGIVRPGDSSKEVWTWLSQIENYGEEKYRARNSKWELWGQKRKFWEERRGQESGNKTACTKNSWRLFWVGNQRLCAEGHIAVSATIWISVGKVHHQIRLRILSCSRVSENHREPEVSEVKVRVVECRDGLARISWKNGTLPQCLFCKTKSGCGLEKGAHFAHRQVDEQPTKRSKKNDDKSAVGMLKKGDWNERVLEPVIKYGHVRSGRPGKKRDHESERGPTQTSII